MRAIQIKIRYQQTKSKPSETGFGKFLIGIKQPHPDRRGCFYFNWLASSIGQLFKPTRLLDIEIQVKFMGMRTQFDVVDFMFDFIFDPHVNGILGEHIALQKEGPIGI
jgi:hypothetical protein